MHFQLITKPELTMPWQRSHPRVLRVQCSVHPSAAASAREADPGPRDVVDDAERLLLRVADDGRAVRGRERQACRGAVHVHEQVPRGQLEHRAAIAIGQPLDSGRN